MLSDFWWIFKERGLSISISFEQSNKAKVVEHISKYFGCVNPLLTEKVFGRVCASYLIIFSPFQHGLKYLLSWWWKQPRIPLKMFLFQQSQYAPKLQILIDGDQQSKFWITPKEIVHLEGKQQGKTSDFLQLLRAKLQNLYEFFSSSEFL